jgi:hypothetical protein
MCASTGIRKDTLNPSSLSSPTGTRLSVRVGSLTDSSGTTRVKDCPMNKYRRWLLETIIDDSKDHFEVPCSRCGTTQHRKQVSIAACTNKRNCDFARAHLHDVMICDDQPEARRGTTSTKRSVVNAQLRLDNKQQNTDRRSTSAAQCQAQRAVDRDKMIVDTPSTGAG